MHEDSRSRFTFTDPRKHGGTCHCQNSCAGTTHFLEGGMQARDVNYILCPRSGGTRALCPDPASEKLRQLFRPLLIALLCGFAGKWKAPIGQSAIWRRYQSCVLYRLLQYWLLAAVSLLAARCSTRFPVWLLTGCLVTVKKL